jgi:hypothetical protein
MRPKTAAGGISPFYEATPLFSHQLDLESLVNLCQASKQLRDQCLDLSDQQLQLIVKQALRQKQVKMAVSDEDFSPDLDSCCTSLAWLLGALSKRWGIMQLAARLDLQQALLAAGQDSLACYILISAGARVTPEFFQYYTGAWDRAYLRLGLYGKMPYTPDTFCSIIHRMAFTLWQKNFSSGSGR